MLGVAVAAGAKGEPVDRLLADLAFARGENERALTSTGRCLPRIPTTRCCSSAGESPRCGLAESAEATALLDRATRGPRRGLAGMECARRRRRSARPVGRGRCGLCPRGGARPRARRSRQQPGLVADAARAMGRGVGGARAGGRARSASCRAWPIISNWRGPPSTLACRQRMPGEGDEAYVARLNDAGVAPPPRATEARGGGLRPGDRAAQQLVRPRRRQSRRAGRAQMNLLASAPGWLAAILFLLLLLAALEDGWRLRISDWISAAIAVAAFVALALAGPVARSVAEFRAVRRGAGGRNLLVRPRQDGRRRHQAAGRIGTVVRPVERLEVLVAIALPAGSWRSS